MPGKCKKSISEQLEICQRRIQGHLNNPNSNMDRYFRLLMRESKLQNELFSTQKNKGKGKPSTRRPRRRDKEESND